MKENVKYESEVLDDQDNGIEEMFEEKNKEAVKVVKVRSIFYRKFFNVSC